MYTCFDLGKIVTKAMSRSLTVIPMPEVTLNVSLSTDFARTSFKMIIKYEIH